MTPHIVAAVRWTGPGGRQRTLYLYNNSHIRLDAETLHWHNTTTPPAAPWRPSTWRRIRRELTTP